ncbi:family 20 glycosylhydrolase [Flavihumibacter sp. UBA7668]|uniref:family 20 glycosylhydrolase n=1 Tax=Flavihumibacter sp. UBA7668 TaxID=1946542 RepID=UPI0025BD652A|nr:family 20 glycosylhydrolase [Flavihumibacter sp. UBA7668]
MKPVFLFSILLIATTVGAQQPSLLPMPSEIQWKEGKLLIKSIRSIQIQDTSLLQLANQLKEHMKGLGANPAIQIGKPTNGLSIQLQKQQQVNKVNSTEGYQLSVSVQGIKLTSVADTGIYYGIQTLKQLMNTDLSFQAAEIFDQPAFSWRGYMVDVGRNYQSIELLKAQIDRMAQYKLNTFHFHVTEDIAWRLEVEGFPELTADSTMLRDVGMYYSIAEIKELMRYCEARYIRFVMEIDMPGHSAAFERATGVSMQSEKGTELVKKILGSVAKTYSPNYLHIGGDEVKITHTKFLPEITRFLDSLGIQHLGWSPGGNIPTSTIHQLWMTDAPIEKGKQYLDSRHLYLNHMDPHEAVVTIFHRQIGDRISADGTMLGGIICVWNDRRLVNENYHLLLNGVYPAMLAFAERSWRGGGLEKWTTVIGAKASDEFNAFENFEKRLMAHKGKYFSRDVFPYWAQSGYQWKLFGPYTNEGEIGRGFEPESTGFINSNPKPSVEAVGGTIILRHWWAPVITGHIKVPMENTTWYAASRIYASNAGYRNCWIGFSNYSRSMNTRAPAIGAWDERGSKIWINHKIIEPPHWKRAGKSVSAETPLTDEDYYYRQPSPIYFKKGWNDVLIKLPVGSFKGTDWQNPVKWMFSFMVLD